MGADHVERPVRLRVEVLAAWDLRLPANNFQDYVAWMASEEQVLREQVSLRFQLGGRCIDTAPATLGAGCQGVARFSKELALFAYGGEPSLGVKVMVLRGAKILSRAVVGSSALDLQQDAPEREPRTVDLLVHREGDACGVVSLRYQLFI